MSQDEKKEVAVQDAGTLEVKEETPAVAPAEVQAPQKLHKDKKSKVKGGGDTGAKKAEKAKEATAKVRREVAALTIKPLEEQKRWEKRGYMREKDEPATHVRHKSKFGIKEAFQLGLQWMAAQYKATGKKIFTVRELIDALGSFGPAYGDCFRNAFEKESRTKHPLTFYREIPKERQKTRAKYEIVLTKLALKEIAEGKWDMPPVAQEAAKEVAAHPEEVAQAVETKPEEVTVTPQ